MSPKVKKGKQRAARSEATRMMQRLFNLHMEADARGVDVERVLDEHREREELRKRFEKGEISRREFLKKAGATGAAAAAAAALASPALARNREAPPPPGEEPRVAIIGAGMAGIYCALTLQAKGIYADVYEADHRIGGRVASHMLNPPPGSRGTHHSIQFGRVVEHGASLISSEHRIVRNLAQSYGLSLSVINGGALLTGESVYLIDGQFYTLEESLADWGVAWSAFRDDLQAAPWVQTFDSYTQRGWELDHTNVYEWFDPAHPYSHPILASNFGPDSNFAKLMYSNIIAEYGAEYWDQPALNCLYTIAWNPKNSLEPLPGTDEYYAIEGGNSQLIYAMAADLQPDQIQKDKKLVAVSGDFMGPYTLDFASGPSVVVDKLVLTVSWGVMKTIDFDQRILDGMHPAKRAALDNMEMGTNGKVHVELAHKTWGPGYEREIEGKVRELNGVLYTDPDGPQCVWDATAHYPDGIAVLVEFLGGAKGANIGAVGCAFGAAKQNEVADFLAVADVAWPGTSDAYTGTAMASNWTQHEHAKGAYVSYGLGGYTSYVGSIAITEGNIHFAGEVASTEYQGYMEGAAETGWNAADEIWRTT